MANKQPANPRSYSAETIVGSCSVFVGVMTCAGNIQIDGVFEGDLSATIHISKSGRVRAHIDTNTCTIHGAVIGDIIATSEVVMTASARVWGEIDTPTLQIQPGAVFKGTSNGTNTIMTQE
ncbi:MAG: bactofilin family protein [Roseiflexaceae bacterium]